MNRAMQKARALPAFLEDRMTRFYEGRVRAEWGGKHLFHAEVFARERNGLRQAGGLHLERPRGRLVEHR